MPAGSARRDRDRAGAAVVLCGAPRVVGGALLVLPGCSGALLVLCCVLGTWWARRFIGALQFVPTSVGFSGARRLVEFTR